MKKIILILIFIFGFTNDIQSQKDYTRDVESLLEKMTLDEKIGQMNQYNGFYDATGPSPILGDAKKKYNNLKNGIEGDISVTYTQMTMPTHPYL